MLKDKTLEFKKDYLIQTVMLLLFSGRYGFYCNWYDGEIHKTFPSYDEAVAYILSLGYRPEGEAESEEAA